jgi:hypothetical protein
MINIKYYFYEKLKDSQKSFNDIRPENLLFFELEPLLKTLIEEREGNAEFLKCPAFIDYYKNCYIVKCPLDLTIEIDKEKEVIRTIYDLEFFNRFVTLRFKGNKKYSMLSLNFSYIFISDKSTKIETLFPTWHKNENNSKINFITGTFNISKWVRPIEYAFEVLKPIEVLNLKRGEPLMYIRFVTDEKVTLERLEFTSEIYSNIESFVGLKRLLPMQSLDRLYTLANPLMNLLKKKLFKKKCPFNFK